MTRVRGGLVFKNPGLGDWCVDYSTSPVVDDLGDVWRIYYSGRDRENRSRISFIDVDARSPGEVLYVHREPLIPLGALGTFDDCGTMPTWVETVGGVKYLYYVGWSVKSTTPFDNHTGLATSADGTVWDKFPGPVLPKTPTEPYFTGTIGILREGSLWRGWYMSGTKWERVGDRVEPYYHIKYAESFDGIYWDRRGAVCIDLRGDEAGICKACVSPTPAGYEMYYSYRKGGDYRNDPGASYRIGYATSPDGLSWDRRDDLVPVGLGITPDAWDAEMVCMPHAIRRGGSLFIFYNGNGFGRGGIGYAEFQE